ncbi:MAG TPA: SUMF1/EgtB/PvdO family nonheme iron enzyme [Mycobacteriales bacterium]
MLVAGYGSFLAGYRLGSPRWSPGPARLLGQRIRTSTEPTDGHIPPLGDAAAHRPVSGPPFRVEPHCVSNLRFATFVGATGYVTDAERFGFSFVFAGLLPGDLGSTEGVWGTEWWWEVAGADWRHPNGPGSTIVDRLDDPVVHVSFRDAQAFCAWSGLRLPTEAEWQAAVRGPDHLQRIGTVAEPTHPRWEWTADLFLPHDGVPAWNGTADLVEIRCLRGDSQTYSPTRTDRDPEPVRMGVVPESSSGNIGFRCLV